MPPAFSTLGWYSKLEEPHLTSVNVFGSIEGHTPSLTFKNPFENHFMLIKSIDRIHYPFLFCRAETSVLTRLMHSFSESPRWISANFLTPKLHLQGKSSVYRRENLFLKALIVFAIIGAISVKREMRPLFQIHSSLDIYHQGYTIKPKVLASAPPLKWMQVVAVS